MANNERYIGSELEIFRNAVNWKRTLRRQIQPYLQGDVLEVGAGIGGTTKALRTGGEQSWTCLEPDAQQAQVIRDSFRNVEVRVGTIFDLRPEEVFDAVVYVDVLEHIEDDRREVLQAAGRLKPGGRLIVLSPAHQHLYSPFDKAIGHFRRYTRQSLRALRPPQLREESSRYLDCVGYLASAVNRIWLSQSMATPRQVAFWDRLLVRLSGILDPLIRYSVGRSILMVWARNSGGEPAGCRGPRSLGTDDAVDVDVH